MAPRRRGVILVLSAGLLYSTAGLFTRLLPFDGWTVLAWRSLFGGLFMIGLVAWESRRFSWRDYALGGAHLWLVPSTAVGTISYIFALKLTTVADVMIIYATVPFVTAAIAWAWIREVPSVRTVAASTLALLGVAVMIGGGAATEDRLLGAVLTLIMNVAFALTLVLARRSPAVSMTPVNAMGVLAASFIAFACGPQEAVGGSIWILALFGSLTIGLAVWFFMLGARALPASEVALLGISDTLIGPALVWLAFGETPGVPTLIGGLIVALALALHLWPEVSRLFGAKPLVR